MEESEIKQAFKDTIDNYPFKTHLEEEVHVEGGRMDIRLPDYNIAVEAKGRAGNIKKGLGQTIYYDEVTNDHVYLLAPYGMISHQVKKVCKSNGVGLFTTDQRGLTIRCLNNVGGLESFTMISETDIDLQRAIKQGSGGMHEVLGGVE
jgi:hypothetical protein